MRVALSIVVLAAAIGAFPAFAGAKPALKALSTRPLEVQGVSFEAGERVLVTAEVKGVLRFKRAVIATRSGTFDVIFENLTLGRCAQPVVSASGSRGSKATLKIPRMACLLF